MTAINVTSVSVLDNPSLFTNPLQFEIQYECLFDLKDGRSCRCRAESWFTNTPDQAAEKLCLLADLEWKLIYVGSAESEKYDQVLDSVLVGPVFPGSYRFVFQVLEGMQAPCMLHAFMLQIPACKKMNMVLQHYMNAEQISMTCRQTLLTMQSFPRMTLLV